MLQAGWLHHERMGSSNKARFHPCFVATLALLLLPSVLMSHHPPTLLFLFSNKFNVKSYFILKTNDLFHTQPKHFGIKQINWLYVLQLFTACLGFTAVQDVEAYFPPFFHAFLKIELD